VNDDVKDPVRRFYELVNDHDLDALGALLIPGFQGHAGAGADADQLRRSLEAFLHAFPDLKWEVRHLIAESDMVSAWITLRGTHEDVFAGVPGSGRPIKAAAWDLFRIDDGRIAELTQFCDLFTIMNQIGALATTAPT
jgi:steroid delta-isomerase-like uncharacterized protein